MHHNLNHNVYFSMMYIIYTWFSIDIYTCVLHQWTTPNKFFSTWVPWPGFLVLGFTWMEPSICAILPMSSPPNSGLKFYRIFPHFPSSTPKSHVFELDSIFIWECGFNPHFVVKWFHFWCHQLWVGSYIHPTSKNKKPWGASDSSTMICGVLISKVTKMR